LACRKLRITHDPGRENLKPVAFCPSPYHSRAFYIDIIP
jgi:hypothetical protein